MSVYPLGATVHRSATVSDDERYRYTLTRSWGAADSTLGSLPFIMLNPSTADAQNDDPTIRRCVSLARSHGYTGIFVMNLFAYRTSKPSVLWKAEGEGIDIVGPDNDTTLGIILTAASQLERPVVAAWGAAPRAGKRIAQVMSLEGAKNLCAFALTASGAPRHPLYLPAESELSPWSTPTVAP